MPATTTLVCPDCLENPAGDQRAGAKRDGRCEPCKTQLVRERLRRNRDLETWA